MILIFDIGSANFDFTAVGVLNLIMRSGSDNFIKFIFRGIERLVLDSLVVINFNLVLLNFRVQNDVAITAYPT